VLVKYNALTSREAYKNAIYEYFSPGFDTDYIKEKTIILNKSIC